ncbi:FAD:protein FMN transferase [Zoogloea sp.]|uniref:FAD:protein FMN transferase n=1 Tax=Zoogloea sp. TaxID=49181 RepID=UPI0035AF6C3F
MGLERMRPGLGTYVSVHAEALPDAPPGALETALEAGFSAIQTVHEAMSFYSSLSDLARLRGAPPGTPVQVSPHTWAVLALALELAEASQGLFDPSIAPQLVLSGALPPPTQALPPDPTGSWQDIRLLPDHHVCCTRSLWLDLGGIAKGYAVDLALAALHARGMVAATVNAGGDLACFGACPLLLQIRPPAQPNTPQPLGWLQNGAAATSGDAFFGRPQAPAHAPVVHPRTGLRPPSPRSITVLAPRCALADGITKILALCPPGPPPAWLDALLLKYAAHAAVLDEHANLRASPGFWQALGHPATPVAPA